MQDAVNAVRLRMDVRPIAGLAEEDRGTRWERVLIEEILREAVEQHNRDVERVKKG